MAATARIRVPAEPQWTHVIRTTTGSMVSEAEPARADDVELVVQQLVDDLVTSPFTEALDVTLDWSSNAIWVEITALTSDLSTNHLVREVEESIGWRIASRLLADASLASEGSQVRVRGRTRR